VLAEYRRLASPAGAGDVAASWLPIPNPGSRIWRLVTTAEPAHAAAVSLWVDGKPGAGGVAIRVRQAWNSILNGAPAPLVVSVTPDVDWSQITAAQSQQLGQLLGDLLQRETWLATLPAALAVPGAGH
jgi:hypothetical protein